MPDPCRCAGCRYDAVTGLYWCWNRCYAPELARFLARDIYPGDLSHPVTLNPYLYCGADPVNAVDPSGMAHGDPLNAGERLAYGLAGLLCQAGGSMIKGIGAGIMVEGGAMVVAGLGLAPETAGATGVGGVAAGGCTIAAGATVWVAGATVDGFGQDMLDMAIRGTEHSTNVERIDSAIRRGDSVAVVREYVPTMVRRLLQ